MEERPFPELKISSPDFLDSLTGRSKCPKCNKSRKYYCYACYVPISEIKDKVPYVKLPIKVDIIKHPSEVDGKSTAPHAGVLAPDHVSIYTYPCIPDYDKEKTVIVFPGDHSVNLEELARQTSAGTKTELSKIEGENSKDLESNVKTGVTESDGTSDEPPHKKARPDGDNIQQEREWTSSSPPFETVVFIDSTWNQSKKIFNDERLSGLRQIELKSYITKFWRYQLDKPNTYLATIEAIYYFLCEFHQQWVSKDYNGEYDNLLFFFNYMYNKIRLYYEGGNDLKAYGGQKNKKSQKEKKKGNS